ncbi:MULTISPECIES: hypothetical protein [Streptomyces]|uniref:Uncharacterized protein n=1 Tax=Streptomyces parvulus TaxID=146923 RepID=A0A191V858_9ACTN|nr:MULTISPECIES: hypothetical protein [Streptomyces]ANJ11204.1 hypothetical protein Spa2297_31965 [Streptomyces parvulus]MCQ4192560.1 hypothetical protein [Streptomyces parvulus]MZD55762.1 hypothetical protein [Streptomyces sp. SID5606]GGR65603.1 hypothetical protein GCM10010220_16430 [Streptomyces parvulus]
MVMRQWWGTAIVAALLLTGCGGGAQAGGASGKAAALSQDEVRDVLPDDAAMPDWKQSARPTAVRMNDLYRREACPIKGNAGCEESRFFGASTFRHDDDAAYVSFLVVAYDSEEAAEKAYDVLWEGSYGKKAGPRARTFDLGPLGDERDARFGTSGFEGEPGAVTQTRVGTTLLWTEAASTGKGGIDEDGVRELATVLADRSRQAQNGDAVSASLGG